MLTSAFDVDRPNVSRQSEDIKPVSSPVKASNRNQKEKLNFLSSNIGTLQGANANQFYHKPTGNGEVIDLILSGMGENMDVTAIKKIAKVKHVISANVDTDNLKGTCKGTGRISIRLNDGEDKETIR